MTHRDKSKTSESEMPMETQSALKSHTDKATLSLWGEFCFLLVHEKKWWLVPILISLALIAVAAAFSPIETVPFIYRLF